MLSLTLLTITAGGPRGAAGDKTWSVKADYIEACSCHLFCACYFNPSPDKDYCDFNNALRVKKGNYGSVKLVGNCGEQALTSRDLRSHRDFDRS